MLSVILCVHRKMSFRESKKKNFFFVVEYIFIVSMSKFFLALLNVWMNKKKYGLIWKIFHIFHISNARVTVKANVCRWYLKGLDFAYDEIVFCIGIWFEKNKIELLYRKTNFFVLRHCRSEYKNLILSLWWLFKE